VTRSPAPDIHVPAKPRPVPTPDTQFYWDRAAEEQLWLPRCDACATLFWYPRDLCPRCGSRQVSWVQASGRGRLAAFVVNHTPHPSYAAEGPYVIALVELDEGLRMMTNIVGIEPDPARLPIGLPLEVVFEDRGEGVKVPQFRPVAA
jgi:uncharacterized OB-fold protein